MTVPIPAPSSGATAIIGALLESRTGQQIGVNRAWRLDTAVKPLLRDLGLDSIDALVAALVASSDATLADRVVDALLNQETSFFRDAAVLDNLADALKAAHVAAPGRRLRIWSAGCSNGQEPLSLAMLLEERGLGTIVDIVASDVSAGAIARARAGRFTQFEIQRGLPIRRAVKWFDTDGADWVADRALVSRIQFRKHNLVADAAPAGIFDAILCRNVMLYFAADVRRTVFASLARVLRPGGLLVLGAGETVIGQTPEFEPSRDWRGFYAPAAPATGLVAAR